jgi:nucleotide-binding universal stress UspA family protein
MRIHDSDNVRHPMITTIAVGTDGSETAAQAVATAAEIARRYGARVVLVSAFPGSERARMDEQPDEAQWSSSPAARVRELLTRTQEDLAATGLDCHVLVDEGDPADVLVRLAEECGADLLVIGNRGMQRRVLGSVPNTVTHKAGCTVLVVKTT